MYKQALTGGALFAGLAVMIGAFGAHGIKEKISADMYHAFETGVQFQFYHSFALLATGILYSSIPVSKLRLASSFFITGIILFSGSLYAMTLMSMNGMSIGPGGIVTPIGGLCFITGWVLLLLGLRNRK